jgi:hypothetical protein
MYMVLKKMLLSTFSFLACALLAFVFSSTAHALTAELLTGSSEAGSTYNGNPHKTYWMDSRYQSIYLRSDLEDAGFVGETTFSEVCFKVYGTPEQDIVDFRIRMQNTGVTSLSSFTTTGWTVVYGPATYTAPASGSWACHTLDNPFVWDGTSNLMIDVYRNDSRYTDGGGNYQRSVSSGRAYRGYCDNCSGCRSGDDCNTPSSRQATNYVLSVQLTSTESNSTPDTPTLQNPADGSADVSITPELVFGYSDDDGNSATRFDLIVDNNSDFSSPVIEETDYATGGPWASGGDISYSVGGGFLLPITQYYWKVRAYDGVGWSDWSDGSWDFTTKQADWWVRSFGTNQDDEVHSVKETSDGGYIVSGDTSHASYGAFLTKLDASGNVIWNKMHNVGSRVLETSDNGYLVYGGTSAYGAGGGDAVIVKTDSSGVQQWSQVIGTSGAEWIWSAQQTSDGGYIASGETDVGGDRDAFVIKFNSSGAQQWARLYGETTTSDVITYIEQTSDGGYIGVGYTTSYGAGAHDLLLIRLDSYGNQVWSKAYGDSAIDHDGLESVTQLSDGSFVAVGRTYEYDSLGDLFIVIVNAAGELQWSRVYRGGDADKGTSVRATSDGGFVVLMNSDSLGDNEIALMKFDALRALEWTKKYGDSETEYALTLSNASDGGYIIGGDTAVSAPPNHWNAVDESGSHDDTSSMVYTTADSANREKDSYTLEDTLQTGTINEVSIHSETQGCADFHILVEGVEYGSLGSVLCNNGFWGTNTSPTVSTFDIPDGFTWDKINDMEVVIDLWQNGGGDGRLTQIWVEVTYNGSQTLELRPDGDGTYTEIESVTPVTGGGTQKNALVMRVNKNGDVFNCGYSEDQNMFLSFFTPIETSFTFSTSTPAFSTVSPSIISDSVTFDEEDVMCLATLPAPTDLRVRTSPGGTLFNNPTGFSYATPFFSAVYTAEDVEYYQVQLTTADDTGYSSVVWDSGKSNYDFSTCTAGNRCDDIFYSAPAPYSDIPFLEPGTNYIWRIKYWDVLDIESEWSANASIGMGAYPLQARIYTGSEDGTGDGYVGYTTNMPWDITHEYTFGSQAAWGESIGDFGYGYVYISSRHYFNTHEMVNMTRGFFPIDTSMLPNVDIVSATLNLYVQTTTNDDNDGDDWLALVQTDQATTSSLHIYDFDDCGAITDPIEGSNRVDIDDLTVDQYEAWTLNTEGLSWIEKDGWSMIGMREGHDALNHEPELNTNHRVQVSSAEADMDERPYLEVTYSTAFETNAIPNTPVVNGVHTGQVGVGHEFGFLAPKTWKESFVQGGVLRDYMKELIYVPSLDKYIGAGYKTGVSTPFYATVWESTDLVNWTEHTVDSGSGLPTLYGVVYDDTNNKYVAFGTESSQIRIWESNNLTSWTQRTVDPEMVSHYPESMIYANSRYIIVGRKNSGTGFEAVVWESTDLINWNERIIEEGSARSIEYADGTYVVGGYTENPDFQATVWESTDLINWTKRIVDTGWSWTSDVKKIEGYWFAAGFKSGGASGNDATVWRSSDLISWTEYVVDNNLLEQTIEAFDYDANSGIYYAAGGEKIGGLTYAKIWSSTDLVSWEREDFDVSVGQGDDTLVINRKNNHVGFAGYTWEKPVGSASDVYVFSSVSKNKEVTYGIDWDMSGGGQLTHIDLDDQGGTTYGVWGDGRFVYVANSGVGLQVYSVGDLGELTLLNTDTTVSAPRDVWGRWANHIRG